MKKNLFLMTLMVSVLAFSFVSCDKDSAVVEEGIPVEDPEPPSNEVHEGVDLGLPSGTLWATMNVGATSPDDYGDYFAWGETSPKEYYYWEDYKWDWGSNGKQLTKYCNNSYYGKDGFTDNKTVLDLEDDAAHVNWGGDWRMPTKEEVDELLTECSWIWAIVNGIGGFIVTGPNDKWPCDKYIFFPASGFRGYGKMHYEFSRGDCWTSSLDLNAPDNPYSAYELSFNSDGKVGRTGYRCYGMTVRPVSSGPKCPSVELVSVSDVTTKSALITGKIISAGSRTLTGRGFCYSSTNTTPTITDAEKVTSTNNSDIYSGTITSLTTNTTYYVRAYATNSVGTAYSEVLTFTTAKDASYYPELDFNGHEFVDLGLPSGTFWASVNIGATKPEGYGDYFAWGETKPKDYYEESNYKYGDYREFTKYCCDSYFGKDGFTDNKTVLDQSDDAAHVNWGGDWRMPTKEEQQELIDKCSWTWTTQNGINGYTVTGPIGSSIFLPASGFRNDYNIYDQGNNSYYWSSSLYRPSSYAAYCLKINGSDVTSRRTVNWQRKYGTLVRAVCSPAK